MQNGIRKLGRTTEITVVLGMRANIGRKAGKRIGMRVEARTKVGAAVKTVIGLGMRGAAREREPLSRNRN